MKPAVSPLFLFSSRNEFFTHDRTGTQWIRRRYHGALDLKWHERLAGTWILIVIDYYTMAHA